MIVKVVKAQRYTPQNKDQTQKNIKVTQVSDLWVSIPQLIELVTILSWFLPYIPSHQNITVPLVMGLSNPKESAKPTPMSTSKTSFCHFFPARQHPISGHYRAASETSFGRHYRPLSAFRRRTDSDPMLRAHWVHFEWKEVSLAGMQNIFLRKQKGSKGY